MHLLFVFLCHIFVHMMSESADPCDDLSKTHETGNLEKINLENKEEKSNLSVETIKQDTERPPESLIKGILNRQGSVTYRNVGWKPTPPVRQSSVSSIKSNSSSSSVHISSSLGSPVIKSPKDQQAYLESQFAEIYNILKDCHVDESMLLKIKH